MAQQLLQCIRPRYATRKVAAAASLTYLHCTSHGIAQSSFSAPSPKAVEQEGPPFKKCSVSLWRGGLGSALQPTPLQMHGQAATASAACPSPPLEQHHRVLEMPPGAACIHLAWNMMNGWRTAWGSARWTTCPWDTRAPRRQNRTCGTGNMLWKLGLASICS